jgi:hypothetical protein
MIELSEIITRLEHTAQAIQSLVDGVNEEQARWKPGPENWSITEVICHLADEEVEDFRRHVDQLLNQTDEPWSLIDPQGWVTQRKYNQQDHCAVLLRFLNERQDSLIWLSRLDSPDWDSKITNEYGSLTAGDCLLSWTAHDLLHLRQLIELHYAYAAAHANPYQVSYAGDW